MSSSKVRSVRALIAVTTVVTALAGPAPSAHAAAAPLPPDAVVLIQGHGWGHGRGMGQWGAKGQADAGRQWSQIVTSYYSGVTIGTRPADEDIRVLLENSSDALVTSDATFTVRWIGGSTVAASDSTYRWWRARHNGTSYVVEKGTSPSGPWTLVGTNSLSVRFQPGSAMLQYVENSGTVRYYHGVIDALHTGTTSVKVINQLSMREYLYGSVPREMPASWATEAVKAQAVAARSYAANKKVRARANGDSYDICVTSCQGYLGAAYRSGVTSSTVNPLENAASNAAVNATAGKVMLSGGNPIFAEYSSSTGGYTAPGSFSYLAPVPDPYDSVSTHHNWDSLIGVDDIESHFPSIGHLVSLAVTKRNGYGDWGGRVLEMQLVGTVKTVTISGSDFRSAFAWPDFHDGLQSSWFRVLFWRGDLAATPPAVSVVSGGSQTVPILMRNAGNTSWPVGGTVRLATASPSKFAGPGWISPTRPASVAANATAPSKTSVYPGEVARFDVKLNAGTVPPGLYFEKLRLYNDGVGAAGAWFSLEIPVVKPIIGVVRGNKWYLRAGGPSDTSFAYGGSSDDKLVGDWNGDGNDTPGVRKGNVWYLNNGTDPNADVVFAFGSSSDRPVVGDWDGDGKDSVGVVRGNVWYLNDGFDPDAEHVFGFGSTSDRVVVGDWNGDGKDTPGVVRGNVWYVNDGLDSNAEHVFAYASSSDTPIVGDWNGDGTETPGAIHGNTWLLNNGLDSKAEMAFVYGLAGDTPIVGDWDGSPPTTPGLVSGNQWALNTAFDGAAEIEFGYGLSSDTPVVGDWDKDGRQTPGVVRDGTWYLNNGFDPNADVVFSYGVGDDIPVVGDWNGDGIDTPGIVRGSQFHLNNGFDGTTETVVDFGETGIPVVGDWDGNGTTTPGIVVGNTWKLDNGFDGTPDIVENFGSGDGTPIVGDWDGNGTTTPGLVIDHTWHLNNSFDGTADLVFGFGSGSARPIAGRWIG